MELVRVLLQHIWIIVSGAHLVDAVLVLFKDVHLEREVGDSVSLLEDDVLDFVLVEGLSLMFFLNLLRAELRMI